MHLRRPRRSGAVPGVAAQDFLHDLDAAAAAHDVAERVRRGDGWQNLSVLGELQAIEVVEIAEGNVGQRPEPGLLMPWQQNGHPFALLATLRRLAEQANGLDAVPFYLRLALDEPHAPGADGAVVWFTDLPSGPY